MKIKNLYTFLKNGDYIKLHKCFRLEEERRLAELHDAERRKAEQREVTVYN